MNLDSLSFTLSQISCLVANLTKKNYKSSVQELSYLVSLQGAEANRHLLRCLLPYVEVGLVDGKTSLQVQVLQQECVSLLTKPNRVTNLCYAFDHPLHQQKSIRPAQQLLPSLSRLLKLSPIQDIVLGLSLLHSSVPETKSSAHNFLKQRLPEFIKSVTDTDHSFAADNILRDLNTDFLHLILSNLVGNSSEHLGIGLESKESLLAFLRQEQSKDSVPVVLAPLLYRDVLDLPMEKLSQDPSAMASNMLEGSLAELVEELGYGCCASVSECKRALSSLGARELSSGAVARVLAAMVRTHSGLEQSPNFWADKEKPDAIPHTWNVEVFVQTVKEVSPNLRWDEVIKELDHPKFAVKDRQGLSLLMTALRLGLKAQGYHPDMFPVDHLYRCWENAEGQLSLIQQILKNSDIFNFADHAFRTVVVDILKVPPDADNKEANMWRSLDLVETLLYLSERNLFAQVMEVMKSAIPVAPDILALALMQANLSNAQKNSPPVVLRQELLAVLLPIFLGNHPNSAIILHHAWHAQNSSFQPIVMVAMADWYIRGDNDQTRLTRILDVSQDLKGLSLLLNEQSYPFVIDLACLASRREFLKLEKWLTDKIQQQGETFITACVKFLQRRCPQIMGGIIKEDSLPKAAQLPHETVATMVACLQVCERNVSPDLAEAIRTTINNCKILLGNPRQPLPGVLRTHHGLESSFNSTSIGAQLFSSPQVDSIAGISSSLAGITLGGSSSSSGTIGPHAGSAFNLPGSLGPLVSTPGSPSRMMGAPTTGQSPFNPMLPLGPQLHTGGPVGSQPSAASNQPLTPSGLSISSLTRLGPQQQDKVRQAGENAPLFPDTQTRDLPVSKEVEDEANSYFQRIYNHPPHPTLSIDEVLDMLKKFQNSPNQREKDVFSCMLRNLFEEYRFFPQYPEKELFITAQLFGGIIERGLVSSNYMALGIALRFVLDALRKPPGTKMFYFGITALERFRSRLKEYHKYCEHLSQLPHFGDFPAQLVEYVESGLKSQEPSGISNSPAPTAALKNVNAVPGSSAAPAKPTVSANVSSRPSIAMATNIDTLLVATEKEEKMTAPPESLQDKIAFIFNNLSQLNLQTKCDDLREIVSDEFWPWVSQYLVMKRASIEFNFHALYSNFLDVLKVPELNKMVIRETFRNIRVLLLSDKGIANFSDRSLLKNLGHWLGMLTLARNKPILQVDMDMKALLAEAYHKGQQELLYVVPFVAKVLEACAKSKVFKPPNPWTMSMMNVLAELHQEPDLKLNLKFEIEVLCKNLNIDVFELKPTVYLKDQDKLRSLEYQLSHPIPKSEPATISTPGILQSSTVTQTQQSVPTTTAAEEMPAQMVSAPVSVAPTPSAATPASATTPTPSLPSVPPEPRFSYLEININSLSSCLNAHLAIPNLQLFQIHSQLKQCIRPAVERAIQEWIHPVVDRSIKIALTTCEQIVKKDFALDPDESHMRAAAHHMVRNLTAGMAMITCRDNLLMSINTNLKTAFLATLIGANAQQKEMVEQAANIVAQENMELACAFIQKTAVEKAIPEIDKRLVNEIEIRKHARAEGRRYCDTVVLTYQAERMPEQVRLKVGAVTPSQMTVYEEFARNIPGFQTLNERDAAIFLPKPVNDIITSAPFPTNAPSQMGFSSATPSVAEVGGEADQLGVQYEKVRLDLEQWLQSGALGLSSTQASQLHSLLEALMLVRSSRDPLLAAALVQRAVEGLQECITQPQPGTSTEVMLRFRDVHLCVLKALQDPQAFGIEWTNKQVTRCLIDSREELKFCLDVVDCLVCSHLLNVPQLDAHVAQAMENGANYMAVAFAMQLLQLYLVEERRNAHVSESDLFNTIDMLARINMHARQPPEGLPNLIELLRANHDPSILADRASGGPTAHIHSGILQAREYEDPPGLLEKTEFLFREWVTIYHSPTASRDPTKAFSLFVHQMNCHGILKTDDLITRFFRISTQMCVDLCYGTLAEQAATSTSPTIVRTKCFRTLDAFVRLIALLVKHSGDASNTATKINLLNKVVGIVAGVLLQDHEVRSDFQQLPYHRIFLILFLELNTPEPVLEVINFQVLTAFCHILHILRPAKAPGFAYAWLELVSHRVFIGRMLAITPQQKGWGMYAQLLIDLFKFLAPFLRNAELNKPVGLFYKGTLRVLLVLLHDFPEFLCDYHYSFCDVIPPNCIQMRNLILSAFPRNMRLPDPFTPNLKVDMLPEISQAPRVLSNIASMIQPPTFKKDLDSYLKARAPVTFLSELRSNLQISHDPGLRYHIQLMNALVLYVGTQAITHIRAKNLVPNMSTIAHSAHMDIFQNLAVDLDTEGRYLFLNAIANQLRYPNSHTHYFSCTLLYLFAEANTEAIQEQITRVLLERLIVNRPHPWGLLITFIELIKNPTYKFWNHEFVHCAPEIEKLFESVARSCMVQKQHVPQSSELELVE